MDINTNIIYFKKCKTIKLDDNNFMNAVKRKIKRSNQIYLFIDPNSILLQDKIFNLLSRENSNIKTTIIYKISKNDESKKYFNKSALYCAEIKKENIENIIYIKLYVYID